MSSDIDPKKYPELFKKKNGIHLNKKRHPREVRPDGVFPRSKKKGHEASEKYWKERENDKKSKYSLSPEWREKNKIRSANRYKKQKPLYNKRRTEWGRKNRDRFRAQWNAWYDRVKDTKRGQQLASRIRNRPLYGLKGSLRKFETGAIGVDELTRLYDAALARLDDVSRRRGQEGRRKETLGKRQQPGSEADCGRSETAPQCDEVKTRHGESAS